MELQLKHIAPYLPYRLKARLSKEGIFNLDSEYPNQYINEICTINNFYLINGEISGSMVVDKSNNHYGFDFDSLSEVEIILRPLNDLFEWVDYSDGHGLVKMGYKYDIVKSDGVYCEQYDAEYGSNPKSCIPLSDYNFWLFKNHFDVFGLIENNLAIDINTL